MNGKSSISYNIFTNNELDNLTIVKKIFEIMEKPLNLIEFVDDRLGYDFRYSLDSTKIRDELNQCESFEVGLNKTIKWYLSNVKWCEKLSNDMLKPPSWKSQT